MKNIKKYTCIYFNEKFFSISSQTLAGLLSTDPLGEDIFLDSSVDLKTLGDAVVKALAKSRDLSISDEDLKELDSLNLGSFKAEHQWILERYPERKLFEIDACVERYNEWVKEIIEKYKYKSKTKIFKNMQNISIELENSKLSFFPSDHDRNEGWSGVTKENPALKLTIPSTSSLEVIGAAVKYAIGNCRGKGADLIRSLLFPDGQPETFEKYIQGLGIE